MLFVSVLLVACEQGSPGGIALSFAAPQSKSLSNRSFTEQAGASLEVSVNDGPAQRYNAQQSDTWTIDVAGIIPGTENTVSLRWFVEIDGSSYDIASQFESFVPDSAQGSHTISADFATDQFDHDGDSVSNLIELYAGGFPSPAEFVPEMVSIEVSGCFLLGSPASEHEPLGYLNEAQVEICNLRDYFIGRHEVTIAQYHQFATGTGRALPAQNSWSADNLPISNVRWSDARDYTIWLSTITGRRYRLPTEAEWEYAARGGSTTAYHTGETIDTSRANFTGPAADADTVAVYFQSVGTDSPELVDGVFRPGVNNQWTEYAIDRQTWKESARFVFEEVQRDARGILIRDAVRDTTVLLDTSRNEIQLVNDDGNSGLLYRIVPGPNALKNLVGRQPVPVGSFPANNFGLQDVHGNVYEWTCSIWQTTYNGAEQLCVDIAPSGSDVTRMIKRGGSWNFAATEMRSANRGWNNQADSSDSWTGFRIALDP